MRGILVDDGISGMKVRLMDLSVFGESSDIGIFLFTPLLLQFPVIKRTI